MRVAVPVRVYPYMTFGKLIFLVTEGPLVSYQSTAGKYARSPGIDISRLYEEFR